VIRGNGSPFIFDDLKGTNWYKRFIAEEYYIMLDQSPDREIIEDEELNGKVDIKDKRVVLYKQKICNFFLKSNGKIDRFSYWDILISLRQIKENIFPDIDFTKTKILKQPSSLFIVLRADFIVILLHRGSLKHKISIVFFPYKGPIQLLISDSKNTAFPDIKSILSDFSKSSFNPF